MHRSFFPQVVTVAIGMTILMGCSKNTPEAEAPSESATNQSQDEDVSGKEAGQAGVKVSDRIREACGLSEHEAHFQYNSAKVTSEANGLLQKLADCFSAGPLAGERMALVGHTDPRGDEEYNMVLGGRRSDAVGSAIGKKGLATDKIQTTSRGEAEARGSDESGWRMDRRVYIDVAE
jgi:peptidoglycan-associated lipoprotein